MANIENKVKKKKHNRNVVWYSVLQHEGCLHNVPVYRLVLTARRIMAKKGAHSAVWTEGTRHLFEHVMASVPS